MGFNFDKFDEDIKKNKTFDIKTEIGGDIESLKQTIQSSISNSDKIKKSTSRNQNISLPLPQNHSKTIWDKLKFIGKNTGTGVLSGTAGIAQTGLTEMANEMDKGKEKDIGTILGDSANAIIGLTNPVQGINNMIKNIPNNIKDTVNIFKDKDTGIGEKLTNIGLNATTEALNAQPSKQLFNTSNQLMGKINPNASNEVLKINNTISEPIKELQDNLAEEAKEYGEITQTLGGVGQAVGNMIPSIAVGAITKNPGASLATMGISAKGQATQDALNRGAELDKAVKIGNTKAMIEVGTEMLIGGVNIFGKGALDDIIEKGIDKKVKNEVANFLIKKGIGVSGEVLEETISDILGTAIDKGTVDPNAKYSLKDWGDTAITTILTTLVLNGITGGIGGKNITKNNQNTEQITPIENNQETNYDYLQGAETKSIDEILPLLTEGGYRDEISINNLREDIKKNGIRKPIELIKNENGEIEINDGNHRLAIAKELGLKEIPVKFLDRDIKEIKDIAKYNERLYNEENRKIAEEEYDATNRTSKGVNSNIEGSGNIEGSNGTNIISNENRSTTEENDTVYRGEQEYNNRPSSDTTRIENNKWKKVEDSNKGSFSIPEQKISRREVIAQNREIAKANIQNIGNWEDKSNGIKYQRETMERNMLDIIPNKQEAQNMIDTYFTPVHESEANKQRFINKYNEKIKELDLNKYESEAVQYFGEKKYNPEFTEEGIEEVVNRIDNNIKNSKIDEEKVSKAIETFRNIYDELFDMENEILRQNGYKEKPYRKGYFPHFIDYTPTTKTENILNKLGFKIDKRTLPTDIAGITEQFVPGKTWNRSSLERKTNKTEYNALKGFDTYISQAADNIFHTDNIQKLRALENEIRYQYSDKGIQDRIDEIYNDDILTAEEQQDRIEDIFKQVENPMPNLVVELRRYTNALANKKSEADRSAEQRFGRPIYSTVNAIENRFGANAVGLNIGSAVTNFIPIVQAYSQVSTKNMGRATIDTIKSYIKDDGFVDNSTFLTNRLQQSEKLFKTSLEKISDKSSFLFNGIDNVTSNIVVRGKYLENLEKGMSESEAMKDANSFGAKVIGDRSKGSLPTVFEEKNPITKAFTQFQLEVNNQYSYMFKDLPRDLKEKGLASIALAFFKMFVASWLYNLASEKVTGRKSAFDPIDIAVSSYKTLKDPDMTTADKTLSIGKRIVGEVPFVGGFFDGGRIPVSGALPDMGNTYKAMVGLTTGEMDSKKAINTLGKELSKPLYYLLPPFAGAQAKKSIEGISTVANGGSYGVDSNGEKILQFPVENPKGSDYVKAGIFGKYALPMAKEYSDREYKSLNAKQTKMYEESKLPYKALLDYIDKGLEKKEDKITYLENQNLNEHQKWGIYKHDIFSNVERDDGGSQLSDAEYITSNGVSKTNFIKLYNKAQKEDISIPTKDEYKEMKQNGITLNNYIDYNIKIKQATKAKRKKGELNEDQTLKNTDKIQILLDSKYSDKEKSAIYEKYIKTQTKEGELDNFQVIKASNINIDEYLKYEQQDFSSDVTDDGSLKGKSERNKKDKIIKYLNSMNIEGNQRLLLYAMHGYTTKQEEKEQLINYVKNLQLNNDEILMLYDKFSGFTANKDGTVDVEW